MKSQIKTVEDVKLEIDQEWGPQPLRCVLTSALVKFLSRLYVGTIQKTSGSDRS